jgi:nucleoside-diphosphate-sugar epimerase
MVNILITGTTGFVGCELVNSLASNPNYSLFELRRNKNSHPPEWVGNFLYVDGLELVSNWSKLLNNIDVVIHVAGLAHNKARNDEHLFDVNCNATNLLAKGAKEAGVKHFVFLSSIGVCGNNSEGDKFNEQFEEPHNAYSLSKKSAEQMIKKVCQSGQMKFTIVRPPLIYGKGAEGNFALLSKLIDKIPFVPFGLCSAKRSFISIYNLIDFIEVITVKGGENQTYVISDGDDLSTKEFVRLLAIAKNKRIYQMPFPKFAFMLLGKSSMIPQLFSPLEIDISKAKSNLNWSPKYTPAESMIRIFNH